MTNNDRDRGRRARRRQALIRRRIRIAIAAAAIVVLVILAVAFIRRANSGGNDAPIAPTVAATGLVLSSSEATASPAPSMEASAASTAEPTQGAAAGTDAAAAAIADVPSANGLRSVHIRVLGDIIIHERQLIMAKQSDGTYDFDPQFAYIKDSLGAADYTIANLETTVGKYKDMGYTGYPQFNTPESLLKTLKDCSIDFFTMANNHMLDRWFDGLINDVDLVEKYGFDHVGAYRTQKERNAPVVYEINGIKIGFVAYTHATNTMENYSDKAAVQYGVPYLYSSDIEGDIKKLRDAGAEVVIALPHWGTENVNEPDEVQYKYAKRLAKAGADIILGSHSHMVQPMQLVEDPGSNRQVFVIYSMGNFISATETQYCDSGIILDFTIREQSDGSFRVGDVGYVPIYVWKQDGNYAVVSSAKYLTERPDGMNDEQYNQMVKTYHEIVDRLGTDGFTVLTE